MNLEWENASEILNRNISGFRQFLFGESVLPVFISQNFCDMTGYEKDELKESVSGIIHPADKALYADFLKRCSQAAKTCTAEYRILKKDTSVLHVREEMTLERKEDGTLIGYSVLTDITEIRSENDNLHFLNETVPCGMLKYTCDKNPKITYMNRRMKEILRCPQVKQGEIDYWELYKDDIYLMIPIEKRGKFAALLERAYDQRTPVTGELTILRCDGTKVRLFGWITKITNPDGTEEYQSVCMDMTDGYESRITSESERYLQAISAVYEKIFEFDFANGTVKYILGGSDAFDRIRNLPMHMEKATEQWIEHSVCEQDRASVREFFFGVFANRFATDRKHPPQIRFRAKTNAGVCSYMGIFLELTTDTLLFCVRKMQDEQEADQLRSENLSLRSRSEHLRDMVMRCTDGMVAFEAVGEDVTPLYASDNVCEFFGFSHEEWFELMQKSTPLKEFVSRCAVGYEKFKKLFQDGEAEFIYLDMESGKKMRMKAICSQKCADENSPRYIMLYKMNPVEKQEVDGEARSRIYIRTFGYFDVFVDGKPIAFRNKKAKELLALLVDRRGGYVTGNEAIGYLWEDEPVSAVTLARYRKEALRLKNTLEEYGIGDIIKSVDGKRRLITDSVNCDLYDYLSGKEEYARLFKGTYLTNYAWGEMTLGELTNDSMNPA